MNHALYLNSSDVVTERLAASSASVPNSESKGGFALPAEKTGQLSPVPVS
jgi:hypothetical protein